MVLFRTTGLIWRRAATSTGGDSHEYVAKMGSRVSFIRTNHLIVTPGCLLTASHLKKTKTLPLYAEPSMVGSRWDSVSLSTVETLKKKKRRKTCSSVSLSSRDAGASGIGEWTGTLESSRYRLWLRTLCTLHSKWPPLPSRLWIINVKSVGPSFAIAHSNTVQFASHTCFSEGY